MRKDPVERFFKYFVWASIAVVLLAIALSSGGRRLGRLLRTEIMDAVEEQPVR